MKYILGNILLLTIIFPLRISAQTDFKNDLTLQEIDELKVEIKQDYQLYIDGVLNLVDDGIDNNLKYVSRDLIRELFWNSNSRIEDYITEDRTERKYVHEYTLDLINMDYSMPILEKRIKFYDSVYVFTPNQGNNINNNKSYDESRNYNIYLGEAYVYEESINSQLLESNTDLPILNLYRNGVIKKINFRIAHNPYDEYELGISSIDIVKPNNVNYKNLKSNILKAPSLWTDKAEEAYVEEVKSYLISSGMDINPPPLPLIVDYKVPSLTIWDYLIPGKGHSKFIESQKAKKIGQWYKRALASTLVAATYFKIREIDYRNRHNNGLSTTDLPYDCRADQNKFYFKMALLAGGATLLINISDISGRLRKQKNMQKYINRNKSNRSLSNVSLQISPSLLLLSYRLY